MLEESAPLVKIDHQHRNPPIRTLSDRLVDRIQEHFSVTNIRVGMVVAGGSAAFVKEAWIDIGNLGQCTCRAIRKKPGEWTTDWQIFRAPERQDRNVAVIIISAHAGCAGALRTQSHRWYLLRHPGAGFERDRQASEESRSKLNERLGEPGWSRTTDLTLRPSIAADSITVPHQ